ncbi:MAG: hypothetical protein ISS31_08290 [Kiritimatiellae bacterium]|nr:hypothetical protein [Kiritimatiellia bacterium]
MKADPILKELWKIKDGLSEECGHDLRRLFDRLKASQKSQVSPVVNLTKTASRGHCRAIGTSVLT